MNSELTRKREEQVRQILESKSPLTFKRKIITANQSQRSVLISDPFLPSNNLAFPYESIVRNELTGLIEPNDHIFWCNKNRSGAKTYHKQIIISFNIAFYFLLDPFGFVFKPVGSTEDRSCEKIIHALHENDISENQLSLVHVDEYCFILRYNSQSVIPKDRLARFSLSITPMTKKALSHHVFNGYLSEGLIFVGAYHPLEYAT